MIKPVNSFSFMVDQSVISTSGSSKSPSGAALGVVMAHKVVKSASKNNASAAKQ